MTSKEQEAAGAKPEAVEGDESFKRGNWSNQVEFTLSCMGYAVGLGNFWRFPYMCMKNGGGAFLIPYFTFLFLCGLPLFFLELTLGQFSNLSPVTVWKISPLFKGIGWGMVVVSGIMCLYYNIIIAWCMYYLGMSFASEVPWKSCGNEWNTPMCRIRSVNHSLNASVDDYMTTTVATYTSAATTAGTNITLNVTKFFTPAEEFWNNKILGMSSGIDEIGGIKWELLVCLIAAWVLTFLCLFKGVQSLGKVVYVSATFPYVFLTILLIRGLTLPGSLEGIKYYIIPDWSRLAEFNVWAEACLQIFYSLGPAWGGLVTMASYNKFDNNHLRDSIIVCVACSGTSFYAGFVIFSVIGYMAYDAGVQVDQVITQGPGLAFIAYPEAISKMPLSPLWAVLFFLMLITLGIDSQFGTLETVISGFVDEYPNLLQKRKTWFTLFVCIVMCVVGLPLTTRAGMYIFQIVDWYCAAFSVMVIGFLECIVLSWIYGVRRLYYDITLMLHTPPSYWWAASWNVITPLILLIILVFSCFQMSEPMLGTYHYPRWAIGMGWCLAMCSIVPIPLIAIYKLANAKGTAVQRLHSLTRPTPDYGPAKESLRAEYRYEAPQYYLSFSKNINRSQCPPPTEMETATINKPEEACV